MSIYDNWQLIRYDLPVQDQLSTLALFDGITDAEIESLTHDVKSSRVGVLLEYLGPVRLQKFLPQFLTFLQDYNWPGARGTDRMLVAAGEMMAPEIRRVFRESNDATWKYWIIWTVVWYWNTELIASIKPELLHLIQSPDREGAVFAAFDLLITKNLLSSEERNGLHHQLREVFQTMRPTKYESALWPQIQAGLLAELDEVMQKAL